LRGGVLSHIYMVDKNSRNMLCTLFSISTFLSHKIVLSALCNQMESASHHKSRTRVCLLYI